MKKIFARNVARTALAMLLITMVVSTVSATSIPQQLEEARMKYERLYKEYTQNLSDSTSSTRHALAGQVEAAKRRYEDLKKQFSMSQKTKDNIKNTSGKVAETVGRIFSTGDHASAPVATSTTAKVLPGYDDQSISISGDNYCGQFAMTSVCHGMGIPMDPQKAYKDSNPAGIFTAPTTIVEYLNMNGVAASQKHNASINDIIKKIDSGKPVMVLMASGPKPTDVHWVNIFGYETDGAGNITSLRMRDSYWGTSKGYNMDIERFTAAWKAPLGDKFPGNLSGYSNLMIDIEGPREAAFSPPLINLNFHTATADNIAGGINDVVTGFKRISPTQALGGIVKCGLGIPGAVLGLTGQGLNAGGTAMLSWGRNKLSQPGLGSKLAGGAAVIGGGISKAAGWVAGTAGNLVSSAATIAGNAIKKLGYVFAR